MIGNAHHDGATEQVYGRKPTAVRQISDLVWEGTNIVFVHEGRRSPRHKTNLYSVRTKAGAMTVLGHIYWFSAWRCYVYAPAPYTVYEKVCGREIFLFCEQRTQEQRDGKNLS